MKCCHQPNVEIFSFSVMKKSHMIPMAKSRVKVKYINGRISLTYDLNCFIKERKCVLIWLNNFWTLYIFHWKIKITEFADEEDCLGHVPNSCGFHALHYTIYFPCLPWIYMFLGMKFLNQSSEDHSLVLCFTLTVSSLDSFIFSLNLPPKVVSTYPVYLRKKKVKMKSGSPFSGKLNFMYTNPRLYTVLPKIPLGGPRCLPNSTLMTSRCFKVACRHKYLLLDETWHTMLGLAPGFFFF